MKGKKTDLSQAECAIARSLHLIGDWWSLLIVRDTLQGKQRFGELQKSLGVAKNILSARLKKLVAEGILQVVPDEESASHRYVLTERGESLSVVLAALWQWGEQACFTPGELKRTLVDAKSRKPVARLVLRAQDGRQLGPYDFTPASVSTAASATRAGPSPTSRAGQKKPASRGERSRSTLSRGRAGF